MARGRPLAKTAVDPTGVYVCARAAACLVGVSIRRVVDWELSGVLKPAVFAGRPLPQSFAGVYRLSDVLKVAARERSVSNGTAG